jgi:hypothetical protein
VVDSKNVVVCEVLTDDDRVAEYIVEQCNDNRHVQIFNYFYEKHAGRHNAFKVT